MKPKKSKGTGGLACRPDALVKVPGITHFSNQVISNTRFESLCSTKGESCRFSPLETPSALCPPQKAGFTLNLKAPVVWLVDPVPLLKCRVLPAFQIKLYRTRGLNPWVRPKGRAAASPLWKPHRFCTRLKRRDVH